MLKSSKKPINYHLLRQNRRAKDLTRRPRGEADGKKLRRGSSSDRSKIPTSKGRAFHNKRNTVRRFILYL